MEDFFYELLKAQNRETAKHALAFGNVRCLRPGGHTIHTESNAGNDRRVEILLRSGSAFYGVPEFRCGGTQGTHYQVESSQCRLTALNCYCLLAGKRTHSGCAITMAMPATNLSRLLQEVPGDTMLMSGPPCTMLTPL